MPLFGRDKNKRPKEPKKSEWDLSRERELQLVDEAWDTTGENIQRLIAAGKISDDVDFYDNRLEIFKQRVKNINWYAVEASRTIFREIEQMERDNPAAAFVAYELVRNYRLAKNDLVTANSAADRARRLQEKLT